MNTHNMPEIPGAVTEKTATARKLGLSDWLDPVKCVVSCKRHSVLTDRLLLFFLAGDNVLPRCDGYCVFAWD